MNIFIKNASYIVTPGDRELVVYRNRDILIEDKFVTCIDTECSKPRDAYIINGYSKVVTPGFINTNTYPALYYIQNYLLKTFSKDLFNNIVKAENELINEDLFKDLSRLICLKLLLSGMIGFVSSTSYPHILLRECKEYGQYIGLSFVKGFKERVSLNSFKSICNEYSKCIPMYGVYDVNNILDPVLLDELNKAARIGFKKKIDVSKSIDEVYLFKKTTGKWPVEYLYNNNLVDRNTLLAHLNWITNMELHYLKTAEPYLSISPSTTLFIGERGFPPLFEFINNNIPVTVGFSGLGNTGLSLFTELKILYFMYRYLYGDVRVDHWKILYHVILYPYMFLGFRDKILQPGSIADLVVLRTSKYSLIDPVLNMFFNNFEVEYVVIGGSIYLSPENKMYYVEKINEYVMNIREKTIL